MIEVDTSINGQRLVAALERLADLRALPLSITVDHGPEFEGQVLDTWACGGEPALHPAPQTGGERIH